MDRRSSGQDTSNAGSAADVADATDANQAVERARACASPGRDPVATRPLLTMTDVLLSSGFLAFARHTGFLAAVEAAGLDVDAVTGTSSGAVVGALWAAGHDHARIAAELGQHRPIDFFRVHRRPWRGLVSLEALIAWLRPLLPARFEDLPRPFAVGVVAAGQGHRLLRAGPLPEAVAASCAIPGIFAAVDVDGLRCSDGGAADRLGLAAFRAWRPDTEVVAHQVARSHGRDQPFDDPGCWRVETPRSGAKFWDLGDFVGQIDETRATVAAALAARGK